MSRLLKESGHAWLGRVPAHWQLVPLGRVFRERKTTVSDVDFEPLSVSMGGVVPRMENVALTANNESRKLVRAGDYVINSRSDRKGSGGIASMDGSVSVISTVLRPIGIVPSYAHHLLRSPAFQEEFYRWGTGIVADLWSTRYASMSKITLPIPPVAEQHAIADFLDRETAKIDALIEKQNQMIRLLRERRNQLIWSVVTGLEHAGQADRGPEPWLPRLPEEWGAASIGYDFLVTLGKMLDAGRDAFEDDVLAPYIRAANIQDSGLALEDVNEMPFRPSELMRLDIRKDDLLVVEGGSIGTSYWVPTDIPGWSFQKTVNRVRSRGRGSTRFLGYVLRAYRDRGILALLGDGSTIAHLTAEKLRSLTVPKPPYDMQTQLADYLDRETVKIDSLLVRAEQFIALARERRAALITAAVTGQIEVLGKAS